MIPSGYDLRLRHPIALAMLLFTSACSSQRDDAANLAVAASAYAENSAIAGPNVRELLSSGSPEVCAAESVREVLRQLIRSSLPASVTGAAAGLTSEQFTQLSNELSVNFHLTQMIEIEPNIATATCAANVVSSLHGKNSGATAIVFRISPSSDDAGSVIVNADLAEAALAARWLVILAAADLRTPGEVSEEDNVSQRLPENDAVEGTIDRQRDGNQS